MNETAFFYRKHCRAQYRHEKFIKKRGVVFFSSAVPFPLFRSEYWARFLFQKHFIKKYFLRLFPFFRIKPIYSADNFCLEITFVLML